MSRKMWILICILAFSLSLNFIFPSVAGLIDNAKEKWKGIHFIEEKYIAAIEEACAIRDENETITGSWTMSGNNTFSGTNTHSGTEKYSGTWKALSGATVDFDTNASITGTLQIASGTTVNYDSNASVTGTMKIASGATVQFDSNASLDGTVKVASGATVQFDDNAKLIAPETVVIRLGSIAAGTDDERPVFVAPYNCELTEVTLVNASAIATDAVSFTTISLRDKGADGTADNLIAAISTDTTAFAAFDGVSMGTLDATHKVLSSGDVVSFKKADSGTGQAIDELLLMLGFKRQ